MGEYQFTRAFGRSLVLGATAVLAAACSADSAELTSATPATVAQVVQREINDWDEFTGRLSAVESVEIRSRVSGHVVKVAFEEGGPIRRGELLFVIDPKPFEAELRRAQAQLASAQMRAGLAERLRVNAEDLRRGGAMSAEEFDERVSDERVAREAVRAARADVHLARLNLSYTRITSPITGRTSRAEVTAGNLVTGSSQGASTLLTTVVSVDPIYVEFDADEQSFLKYQRWAQASAPSNSSDSITQVRMALANEEGFPHSGHLKFLDNRLDPRTGTIRARAMFANPGGRLTPGLFARMQLVGSQSRAAVLVDDRAVGTDQDRRFVLVVNRDRTLEYRAVRLGRLIDGLRIVEEGLKPGELIVVNGLQRLRPGMVVAAQTVPMDLGVLSRRDGGQHAPTRGSETGGSAAG
jgi:RND family efflux transporter MFP subunit